MKKKGIIFLCLEKGIIVNMKKVVISLLVVMFILSMIISYKVYASSGEEILNSETGSQLIEIKEKESKELEDYIEAYGDETYGFTAYILNKVRFFSIPLCFLGIAIGAIYQYVIGIRKLDTRYRGFFAVIAFITVLIICQILPFIFVVVVKFGRS